MRTIYLFLGICIPYLSFSQQKYFQQQVNYTISVQLNDIEHTLAGHISMEYTNNSPHLLDTIYIHLWPNAYKHKATAFFNPANQIESNPFLLCP